MIYKPKIGRSRLYDRMHVISVKALMGLTLLGVSVLGIQAVVILKVSVLHQ